MSSRGGLWLCRLGGLGNGVDLNVPDEFGYIGRGKSIGRGEKQIVLLARPQMSFGGIVAVQGGQETGCKGPVGGGIALQREKRQGRKNQIRHPEKAGSKQTGLKHARHASGPQSWGDCSEE